MKLFTFFRPIRLHFCVLQCTISLYHFCNFKAEPVQVTIKHLRPDKYVLKEYLRSEFTSHCFVIISFGSRLFKLYSIARGNSQTKGKLLFNRFCVRRTKKLPAFHYNLEIQINGNDEVLGKEEGLIQNWPSMECEKGLFAFWILKTFRMSSIACTLFECILM